MHAGGDKQVVERMVSAREVVMEGVIAMLENWWGVVAPFLQKAAKVD